MNVPCIVVSGEASVTKQHVRDILRGENYQARDFFTKEELKSSPDKQREFQDLIRKSAVSSEADDREVAALPPSVRDAPCTPGPRRGDATDEVALLGFPTMKIKILFLSANPKDTSRLRLDEEVRAIRDRLRTSAQGDRFVIEQEWAVRVGDLQGHLLRHEPQIVHFSGHGSPTGGIVLEDQLGSHKIVPPEALKRLFATLKAGIRCVVLNACYSEGQARAIAESIECVIGMSTAVGDTSAVAFATSFYQALARVYHADFENTFPITT
jgi:hypothetical protein